MTAKEEHQLYLQEQLEKFKILQSVKRRQSARENPNEEAQKQKELADRASEEAQLVVEQVGKLLFARYQPQTSNP